MPYPEALDDWSMVETPDCVDMMRQSSEWWVDPNYGDITAMDSPGTDVETETDAEADTTAS